MKYLLITLEYFPFKGGVANYYTNLVYYWPESSRLDVIDNRRNELLRKKGLVRWSRALFTLFPYLKKNRTDYLIVGQILPLGLVAYIFNRCFNVKYSVVLHGLDFSLSIRNAWKRSISRLILKRADKIIAANSYVARLCSDFLAFDQKIKVINPGVKDFSGSIIPRDKFREKNNLADRKVLFSLGRLVERKGFDYVLKALGQIAKSKAETDWLYVIAGCGPADDYLKRTARVELGPSWEKRVKFIGEVSEQEKWSWLSACDLFIMPARNISGDFEGFGIVYLEANLAGRTVIAGRSGGVADAVVSGLNGWLVDPEDISDIQRAIWTLLHDDSLRFKLGQSGRQRALADFAWKKQVESFYNFLKF